MQIAGGQMMAVLCILIGFIGGLAWGASRWKTDMTYVHIIIPIAVLQVGGHRDHGLHPAQGIGRRATRSCAS